MKIKKIIQFLSFLALSMSFADTEGSWTGTTTSDVTDINNDLVLGGSQSRMKMWNGDNPNIWMKRAGSGLDAKNWKFYLSENGNSEFRGVIVNDADTYGSLWLRVKRNSDTVASINFENGDVGIGTTNPSAKLEVYGTNAGTSTIKAFLGYESGGEKWAGYFDGNVGVDGNFQTDVNDGASFIMDTTLPASSTNGAPIFAIQDHENGAGDNPKLQFGKNVGEVEHEMMFDMNWNGTSLGMMGGKVGIGINSPTELLEVNGGASGATVLITGASNQNAALAFQGSKRWQMGTNRDDFGGHDDNFYIRKSTSPAIVPLVIAENGNIGIGSTSPSNLLHINESTASTSAHLQITNNTTGETGANGLYIGVSGSNGSSEIYSYENQDLRIGTNNSFTMYIKPDKKVGIGTSTPDGLLDVEGTSGQVISEDYGAMILKRNTGDQWAPGLQIEKSRGTVASPGNVVQNDILGWLIFRGYDGTYDDAATIKVEVDAEPNSGGDATDMPGRLVFSTTPDGSDSPVQRVIIDNAGNVGIGTTDPIHIFEVANGWSSFQPKAGSGKLMIAGNLNESNDVYLEGFSADTMTSANIHLTGKNGDSTKVKVSGDLDVSHKIDAPEIVAGVLYTKKWKVVDYPYVPDYVFADDYDLKPLSEVESFINENKHLPGIPSAKEVKEEGMEMVEMNMKLLEKIEELTLHTIRLEKNTVRLQKELNELKNK